MNDFLNKNYKKIYNDDSIEELNIGVIWERQQRIWPIVFLVKRKSQWRYSLSVCLQVDKLKWYLLRNCDIECFADHLRPQVEWKYFQNNRQNTFCGLTILKHLNLDRNRILVESAEANSFVLLFDLETFRDANKFEISYLTYLQGVCIHVI